MDTTWAPDSIDGNPGRTVRKADHLTPPGRIAWLAFCSGPCLKREGRQLFPPSDLWKELVCTDHFKDRTQTFEDSLGLPRTIDLVATNGQTVMQYRVTGSTNCLDWEFPLRFELAQYRPSPTPENPHVFMGTNGWELHLIARGKLTAIGPGVAPRVPAEVLKGSGE